MTRLLTLNTILLRKRVQSRANLNLFHPMTKNCWQERFCQRARMHPALEISGKIRHTNADFRVIEQLKFQPSGAGEHDWLLITKSGLTTVEVSEWLAKVAKVPIKHVGFCGLKDKHAISTQAFTLWRPGKKEIDYAAQAPGGVTIDYQTRHTKKLPRGAHAGNRFELVVKGIESSAKSILNNRLEAIQISGVPNYFGSQRFGHELQNMPAAEELLENILAGRAVKMSRYLRGIVLSAARSWLFNEVVSAQLVANSELPYADHQWLNLQSTSSVFVGSERSDARYEQLDIHRTAPLWGKVSAKFESVTPIQMEWEAHCLKEYEPMMLGLERAGLSYERRASRAKVINLVWSFEDSDKASFVNLNVGFELFRGQFATSVLRELISGID